VGACAARSRSGGTRTRPAPRRAGRVAGCSSAGRARACGIGARRRWAWRWTLVGRIANSGAGDFYPRRDGELKRSGVYRAGPRIDRPWRARANSPRAGRALTATHARMGTGCVELRRVLSRSATSGRQKRLEQRLFEGLGLDRQVEGLEGLQQWLHACEGPRVWAVGEGLGGVGVRFHEETRDTGRDRGAR
jgi:hypothetical protein